MQRIYLLRGRVAKLMKCPVGQEHDLPYHASPTQELLRESCVGQRKSMRNQGPDLLLFEQVKQGDQVLSEPPGFQSFEGLYAVGNYPFPSWEKPAASDVQTENCDCTITMT